MIWHARSLALLPVKRRLLTVWRKNKAEEISVTIEAMPGDLGKSASPSTDNGGGQNETTRLPVAHHGDRSEDGNGVVVTDVDPDSDASDRGIRSGDIIVSVNNPDGERRQDINNAISEAESRVARQCCCNCRATTEPLH